MIPFRKTLAALGLLAAVVLAATPPADAQILQGQAGPNFKNLLDNGWMNVKQRTVTANNITTTAKYLQDRWAVYSGTSTTSALTNITTGLPTGTGTPVFTNAAQIQRNSGQTGVKPVCFVQEIPTADITPLAGQPMTISFWAESGSNYSAASGNLGVQLTTGTGTDEGLATLITGFAGAANAINTNAVLTANWQRFAFTGTMAATATEAAVQLCETPVGTAGTNDYFQITGVQLEQGTVATNLESRPYGVELAKVQRYYFDIVESATVIGWRAPCVGVTTSIDACTVTFPVPMRVAPTMTYTAGFAATTTNAQSAITACTGLSTYASLTGAASSTAGVVVDCATSAGTPAAGVPGNLFDIGTVSASGILQASADF